jgi:hypothetical protein
LDEPDRWSSSGYKWIAIPKFQGFCEIVCCRLRSDGRVSDTASSLAVQARNHLANIYTPSDSSRPRSRCMPRIKTLSHSQLPADLVCFLQDHVGFKCHVGLGRPTTVKSGPIMRIKESVAETPPGTCRHGAGMHRPDVSERLRARNSPAKRGSQALCAGIWDIASPPPSKLDR